MAIKQVFLSILVAFVGLSSCAHLCAMEGSCSSGSRNGSKARRSLSLVDTPPPSPGTSANADASSPFPTMMHSSSSSALDSSVNTSFNSLGTAIVGGGAPHAQASPPAGSNSPQTSSAGQDSNSDDDRASGDDGTLAKTSSWTLPIPSPASPYLGIQQGSLQSTPSPERKQRLNAIPLNHLFYSFIKNVLTFADSRDPVYLFVSALFDLQNRDVFGQTRVAIKIPHLNNDFTPLNTNYPVRELCLLLHFWNAPIFGFIAEKFERAIIEQQPQLNQDEISTVITHFFKSTENEANGGKSYKKRSTLPEILKNMVNAYIKCLQKDGKISPQETSHKDLALIIFSFYRTKLIELLEEKITNALTQDSSIRQWHWIDWRAAKRLPLPFADFFQGGLLDEQGGKKEVLSAVVGKAKLSDLLYFNFQDIKRLPALVRSILRTAQEEEEVFIDSQNAYAPATPATAAAFMDEARVKREMYFRYVEQFKYYTNSGFKEINDQLQATSNLGPTEEPLLTALIETFDEICKHADRALNLYPTTLHCLINFARQMIAFAQKLTQSYQMVGLGLLGIQYAALERIAQNTDFNDAVCLQCDHLLDLVRSQSEVAARGERRNLEITLKGGHVLRANQYFIRNALSTQGAYFSGMAVIDTIPTTRYPSPAGIHQNLLVVQQPRSQKVVSKSVFPTCYNANIYQYVHALLEVINNARQHRGLPEDIRCYQETASIFLNDDKEVKRTFIIEHPHSFGCNGNDCGCQPNAAMRVMLCMIEPTELGKNEPEPLIPLVITVFPYGIRHFDLAKFEKLAELEVTFKSWDEGAVTEKTRTIADIHAEVQAVQERLCQTSALDCTPRSDYSGTLVCDIVQPQKWYILCDLPELAWQIQIPAFDSAAMNTLHIFVQRLIGSLDKIDSDVLKELARLANEACPLSRIPAMIHRLTLSPQLKEELEAVEQEIVSLQEQMGRRYHDGIEKN